MSTSSTNLAAILRNAIAISEDNLHVIAKRAGVDYGNLHRFVKGEREQVTLPVASRLFDALGIVVKQPAPRKHK